MKKTRVKHWISVLIITIYLLNQSISVSAMNTGFNTEEVSTETYSNVISRIELKLLLDEPKKKPIVCFDVNGDKMIALGHSEHTAKTITIYSDTGIFLYGYSFVYDGSIGLKWDRENIILFLARSDIAILVDPQAQIKEIRKIVSSKENNSYWNNDVWAESRLVDNAEFIIRNDFGILNLFQNSYSQVVVLYPGEDETIIYDVGIKQLGDFLIFSLLIVLFFLICLMIIAYYHIHRQGKGQGTYCTIHSRGRE